ncbi:MAG: hypothetical protein ACK5MN_03285 [Lachnospiraceae bacterium]
MTDKEKEDIERRKAAIWQRVDDELSLCSENQVDQYYTARNLQYLLTSIQIIERLLKG